MKALSIMTKITALGIVVIVASAATVVKCGSQAGTKDAAESTLVAASDTPSYLPKVLLEPVGADKATETRVFDEAARTAWAFIATGYNAKTGYVAPSPDWAYPTVWDIASAMASYYSARGLGLITTEDYRARTQRVLESLTTARLYNGIAYGRNYDVRTGELIGIDQKPSENGMGFSAMDLGRLLIWLKIVSDDDPTLLPLAKQVAGRLNAKKLIRSGYLQGEQIIETGVSKYQEGRIGYEQYAATGFNFWGMRADRALKASNNARVVNVRGVPLLTDTRGLDRMTSEPFIMHGLELGLAGEMLDMGWQTLALQAKRYEDTGQITIASEDALNDAPHYFYYYCVYCSGKEYAIETHSPGVVLDSPRWISSKGALAWHALKPSKYTWMAVEIVQPAMKKGKGWDTGVYEKTNKPTEVMSLNTAAVILEAALYFKTGRPLSVRSSPTAAKT